MRHSFHLKQRTGKPPRVCAVVLNWNRPAETLECLDSLLPFVQQQQLLLVVVDNASTDASIDQLSTWGATHLCASSGRENTEPVERPHDNDWDYLLIKNDDNLGYAAGNNVGIKAALDRRGVEYIWILNNDTVIDERALEHLLDDAARHPATGIFGSTVLDSAPPNLVQCAGGCRYYPAVTILRKVLGRTRPDGIANRSADVKLDYVSGVALFCRAELFRRVGLFDERFFLYYEETDLCHRARSMGYALKWCPGSIIYHKGGVSTGARSSAGQRDLWLSSYHENLSTLLYTRKHHPRLLPLAAALRFLGKSIVYLWRGQPGLLRTLTAAYRDALTWRLKASSNSGRESTVVTMGSSVSVGKQ